MQRRDLGLVAGLGSLAMLAGRKTVKAQSRRGPSLQGVWRVSVTSGPGAPPGFPARWETLISYAAGGTVLEYNGGPGFTPAHGVWLYAGNGMFEGTWFRYNYNPQGEIQAVTKVRSRIRMTSDDEYTNEARVDVYGPNGQIVVSWPSAGHGRRIVIEPLD